MKPIHFRIWLLQILIAPVWMYAQVPNKDSLLAVWNDVARSDTARMRALDELCWRGFMGYFQDMDSADFYSKKLLHMAQERRDAGYQSKAWIIQGDILRNRGVYDEARQANIRAFDLAVQINDLQEMAHSQYGLATSCMEQNMNDSADKVFRRARDLFESIQDTLGLNKTLIGLANVLSNKGRYDEAIATYEQCYAQAKSIADTTAWAYAAINNAILLRVKGHLDRALVLANESVALFDKIDDRFSLAGATSVLASIYQTRGDHMHALDIFLEALKLSESVGDEQSTAIAMLNIASVHQEQDDLEHALVWYSRTLDVCRSADLVECALRAMLGIGGVQEIKTPGSGVPIFQKALEKSIELGNPNTHAAVLHELGKGFLAAQSVDSAEKYLTQALTIQDSIGDKESRPGTLVALARAHRERGDIVNSLSLADRGMQEARENGSKAAVRDAALILYMIHKDAGNLTLALRMHEIYASMKDSLGDIENRREVIERNLRYDYDKELLADSLAEVRAVHLDREHDRMARLSHERRNTIQYILIFLALVVLSVLVLMGRFRRVGMRIVNVSVFALFLIVFELVVVVMHPYIAEWSHHEIGVMLALHTAFCLFDCATA
jgi:tetratricopeptide (TPR) repeat protein